MKKYPLTKDQESFLQASFVQISLQDGMMQSMEAVSEIISQAARRLMTATPDCPEQLEGIRNLRQAEHWFRDAVQKHGDF